MGCTLMYSLMMNSIRARPTPSLGRKDVLKARSGLPRLIMIWVRGRAMSPTSVRSTWKLIAPEYTRPESPSAHDTVTTAPSGTDVVASPVPTTAGMPSSRAMIDAWQVRPPRLVTIAAAVFITGSQSGVVVSAISTWPGLKSASCVRFSMRFTPPVAIFSPTERPSVRISPLPSST